MVVGIAFLVCCAMLLATVCAWSLWCFDNPNVLVTSGFRAVVQLLSFPLRKVKEDALSLTRVSVLLPADHSEAAAFKEVVALHHPERGIGAFGLVW